MHASTFPQLQVFLAVARNKSFSGAARELGMSTSAVSQSVKQLEEHLRVVLLTRTTRAVAPTEAGARLIESAGPAIKQAEEALASASAKPGEVVGRVKISVSRTSAPFVLTPVVPAFRAQYPRVELEIVIEERLVDIVAEGYDAAIRLTEAVERDMVQVRLTDELRFIIVGSPAYLDKHGTPKTPQDLLKHECITFRSQTSGALYAWELERGPKSWRVPVRGGVVTNEPQFCVAMAEQGVGLAYTFESSVAEQLRAGTLKKVLDSYAPVVPGFFLCYPSRAQSSPALRLFVELARKLLARGRTSERG
ncbi:MAG: LysR family transcriptional regulator [Kofleriaceae bacterium]